MPGSAYHEQGGVDAFPWQGRAQQGVSPPSGGPVRLKKRGHSLEQGGCDSIGSIALVHIVLYHQAAVKLGLVLRVMLVSIIGVHCMAHVS